MFDRLFGLKRLLTPQRLRYPWFIGAALWAGWLISLLSGFLSGGAADRFGQIIGTDFIAFYTAGKILLLGRPGELYSLELAHQIQQSIYSGGSLNFNPYLNPPLYALLFIPFAALAYPLSPILWMGLNLLAFGLALKALGVKNVRRTFLLSLTWLPAWTAISFGQNTFISLLLFSAAFWLWRKERRLAAGLMCGLLLYKPQLLPGIVILWLLNWRKDWGALAGLALCAALQAGLSLALMPEASLAYLTYAQKIGANLMHLVDFPIWNAHGVYTFWIGLLPNLHSLSLWLYLACALGGLAFFFRFWIHLRQSPSLLFAGAIALTVCITPYLMVYDWALLLIPAIILWAELPLKRPYWQVIFALLWAVMFFSGALTAFQWRALGWAVQISLPVLFWMLAASWQALRQEPPPVNGE